MATYFISDIHLHAKSVTQMQMLLDFFATKGSEADAIYILGDLFAIWLGDDIREPYSEELIAALRTLTKSNIPVYFMRGNRDFLVGERFCKATGCQMLDDPCTINLYGEDVLLTHGDCLCTLDVRYQKFRRVVQNPMLDCLFLLFPQSWRKKIGRLLSSKSRGSPQDPATYDVEDATVEQWFSKFNVTTMIHGHTHKPAIHKTQEFTRIVLGDWNPGHAKILRWKDRDFELQVLG